MRIFGKALPIIFWAFLLFGCSANQTNLEKVKGDNLTFSEYFHTYDGLKDRKNSNFYRPLELDEVQSSSLPDEMKKVIHPVNLDSLPFKVKEEKVYFVSSTNKDGEEVSQVQVSFLGKNEYGNTDEFFIISVTESDRNPLEGHVISDEIDSVGNKLVKGHLTKDLPIYQQVRTTNGALLYRYYYYDEADKKVAIVGTAADEFYTYYNGYIYHIGYLIDNEKNDEEMQGKMLQLAREYTLGNSFQQTGSIEATANQTVNNYKARILNVDTDLEKEHGSHYVPEGVNTMTISVAAENVESILFWISETGTVPWAERTILIGYDIDGSDGWSITWEFGDRTFLDYITIQALGNDGATQATEYINLRSRSAETESD